MDEQIAAKLRAPFDPKHIGKLPKPTKKDNPKGKCDFCKGYHGLPAVHLDFVGHAAATDRLLSVDPEWTWEPMAFNPDGSPVISTTPTGLALWIRMTVAGVTRPGVGTVDNGANDPLKELISDAIRNAAMRFGVALDLWAKEDLTPIVHDSPDPAPTARNPQPGPTAPPAPQNGARGKSGANGDNLARASELRNAILAASRDRPAGIFQPSPSQLGRMGVAELEALADELGIGADAEPGIGYGG